MDWAHALLGGLLIVAVLLGFTRRRRRSVRITIELEREDQDSTERGGTDDDAAGER